MLSNNETRLSIVYDFKESVIIVLSQTVVTSNHAVESKEFFRLFNICDTISGFSQGLIQIESSRDFSLQTNV